MIKKISLAMSALIVLAACGSNNNSNSNSSGTSGDGTAAVDSSAAASSAATTLGNGISQADYDKGLALVAKSDCLTCHKVSEKLVGPAYKDVANKYKGDAATISMLADKVIKGGAGNWGQMAMTPHPQLAKADAEQMVKYVLSLK